MKAYTFDGLLATMREGAAALIQASTLVEVLLPPGEELTRCREAAKALRAHVDALQGEVAPQ